jgi:hypothetical protein
MCNAIGEKDGEGVLGRMDPSYGAGPQVSDHGNTDLMHVLLRVEMVTFTVTVHLAHVLGISSAETSLCVCHWHGKRGPAWIAAGLVGLSSWLLLR